MKSKILLPLLGVASITLLLTGCPDYTTTFTDSGDVYHTAINNPKGIYPEHCSVSIANHLFSAAAKTERDACIRATKVCREWITKHRSTNLETFVCKDASDTITKRSEPNSGS